MSTNTSADRLRRHLDEYVTSASQAHERLPAERELAAQFDVSRETVRRALDRLERAGRVYRIQGSGTFVSEPRVSKSLELTSFSEDMRDRGMVPGSAELRITRASAGEACFALDLSPHEPVVRIHRVRTADGIPMAVENIVIPAALVPDDFDLTPEGSLYAVMQQHSVLQVDRAEQRIQAVIVDEESAVALGVPVFSPGLRVERTVFDLRGRPVEHAVSLYRGDRYDYSMMIYRRPVEG